MKDKLINAAFILWICFWIAYGFLGVSYHLIEGYHICQKYPVQSYMSKIWKAEKNQSKGQCIEYLLKN